MPSTFVHALLPASCVIVAKRSLPKLSLSAWIRMLFVAAFFANSPDLDVIPASLMPSSWSDIHRNWGHNIFFCVFLIAISGPIIRRFVSSEIPKRVAYLMGAMLVSSHLILDSMMNIREGLGRPGVPLLWPFSGQDFHLPWAMFNCIDYKHDPIHPLVGYATSTAFWEHIVYQEFFNSLVLLGIWAATLASIATIRHLIHRARRSSTKGSTVKVAN